jgi:chemotaxis protein MotB
MKYRLLIPILALTLFSSCVSQRKYNDMYALWVLADGQYQLMKQQIAANNKNCNQLVLDANVLRQEVIRLKRDSVVIDSVFRYYVDTTEKVKVSLTKELQGQTSRLSQSTAKVVELEDLLQRKDSIMNTTRERLAAALIGFKDKGISVQTIGGKVYISLDERLLFQSGQIDVNPAGRQALLEVASALNQDTTTILTVEGHTDDVEYKGKNKLLKDNWDISVLRATSVVRILQHNGKVKPTRFIAAGRAEFYPVDPAKTPESRRKNRRIEIILTPDLEEIVKLLQIK